MRLLLEPQIFNNQKFGGISRYYTEIFSFLLNEKGVEFDIPLYYTNNIYFNESNLISTTQKRVLFLVRFLTSMGISLRGKINKKNYNKSTRALRNKDYDLVIPTYFDTYFLNFIDNKPFVLTVYDMIHELYPQFFENGEEIINNKKILIQKATKIIAVSNNTKSDILKFYPHVDSSTIEVIYHGNSIEINNNVKLNLPEKYILFVGIRSFYKNFIFFINSIKELLLSDENLYVVCAGGGKFNDEEIIFINELGLNNQVIYYHFKEDELGLIYSNAKCFVFPSEYEGFGIPILEAMSCGCPVILTNNSSFPEVAGEAGIFFELNDENDLKNKVTSVINDETLANLS